MCREVCIVQDDSAARIDRALHIAFPQGCSTHAERSHHTPSQNSWHCTATFRCQFQRPGYPFWGYRTCSTHTEAYTGDTTRCKYHNIDSVREWGGSPRSDMSGRWQARHFLQAGFLPRLWMARTWLSPERSSNDPGDKNILSSLEKEEHTCRVFTPTLHRHSLNQKGLFWSRVPHKLAKNVATFERSLKRGDCGLTSRVSVWGIGRCR